MSTPEVSRDRQLELVTLAVGYHHEKRFGQVLEILRPEHFFYPDTRAAFLWMREAYQENRPVRAGILLKSSPVSRTVVSELQVQAIPDADPAGWCEELVEHWMRREGLRMAEKMTTAFGSPGQRPQDLCSHAVRRFEELLTRSAPTENLVSMKTVTERLAAQWDVRRSSSGLRTTLADLNQTIGGIQPAELVILGARPSAGKTTLVLNWFAHWASIGQKCLFVSAETTADKLAERILSAQSRVNGHRLTTQRQYLTREEDQRARDQLPKLAWDHLMIFDPPTVRMDDLFWVGEVARRRMDGLDVIAVDYLQLISVDMGRRDYTTNDRIAEVSKRLRALAKRFAVPVIAVSQLSRLAADEEPELHHLRESGQLEQDADLVLLLWRKDVTPKGGIGIHYEHWLKVAKQKNGPLARMELAYDADCFRFESIYAEAS